MISFSTQISGASARLAAALCALVLAMLAGGVASAQDLQGELDAKRSQLEQSKRQKQVLTSELARYSSRVDQLAGELAVLRNREALVAEQLRQTQARLGREIQNLEALRARLGRSLTALRERLVAIYKSDQPDALTVILNSSGFDDLVNRYDYLSRVSDQDGEIVGRVRGLRDRSRATVERVRAARNEIAAKRDELARTRSQVEAREAALAAARDRKAGALATVRSSIGTLEEDVGDLNARIERQLRQAQASTTTSDPLPAGPIRQGSGDLIYPVNGPLTSPFGFRWGRLHAGIDIAVPEGTPIRAAKAGRVALAEYYGGYGNYTCIDHGGGLSTCYGHQSGFKVSVGDSVSQGQVIGYSGNTGSSTGPHLHFEVRVNGTPVDPLGYL